MKIARLVLGTLIGCAAAVLFVELGLGALNFGDSFLAAWLVLCVPGAVAVAFLLRKVPALLGGPEGRTLARHPGAFVFKSTGGGGLGAIAMLVTFVGTALLRAPMLAPVFGVCFALGLLVAFGLSRLNQSRTKRDSDRRLFGARP